MHLDGWWVVRTSFKQQEVTQATGSDLWPRDESTMTTLRDVVG